MPERKHLLTMENSVVLLLCSTATTYKHTVTEAANQAAKTTYYVVRSTALWAFDPYTIPNGEQTRANPQVNPSRTTNND